MEKKTSPSIKQQLIVLAEFNRRLKARIAALKNLKK
jgi:hypothetical protein